MNQLILIIMLVIYGASTAFAYLYIKKAHSKGGIWSNLTIGITEYIEMVTPLYNTFYMIAYFTGNYKRAKNKTYL